MAKNRLGIPPTFSCTNGIDIVDRRSSSTRYKATIYILESTNSTLFIDIRVPTDRFVTTAKIGEAKKRKIPPLPSYINDIDFLAPCSSSLPYKTTIYKLEVKNMKPFMNILGRQSHQRHNNQHQRSNDVKCSLRIRISLASII